MARHIGGEYPSQHIRTAPTPSNPNTPTVGDPAYGQLVRFHVQWGSEIRTSLDLGWSKIGWAASGPDFECDLKSGSPAF